MKDRFTKSGYHITTDPRFISELYGIPPELEKQMETLVRRSMDKGDKKIIGKLGELIEKYPQSPQLKNYLSVAYNAQGNTEMALTINEQISLDHSNYLFGKLNRANELIHKGHAGKVPMLLGDAMELKSLYPERETFHLAEVTGFLNSAVRYFAAIKDLELAENRFKILKELAPTHRDTLQAEVTILELKEQLLEEGHDILPPKPGLIHPEVGQLYEYGIDIPNDVLVQILALPRESLISDLETVLQSAIENGDNYFLIEEDEETQSFAIHAIFLLTELEAYESLPKIITFLKEDEDFLDFWLGDHLVQTIWQCFYVLGFNNTEILRDLLLTPECYTYVKSAVSEALSQMLLRHPAKREEVLNIYTEFLRKYINSGRDGEYYDPALLELCVIDMAYCQYKELLPLIKSLFGKKLIDDLVLKHFSMVEQLMRDAGEENTLQEVYSIYDLYDHVLETWACYQPGYAPDALEEDFDEFDDEFDDEFEEDEDDEDMRFAYHFDKDRATPKSLVQAVSEKINRNELCPCGSGKKYKKCCMTK